MNYEKKYNEALGWMREMYPCLTDSLREDAEHFFPELRESEDERIIQNLIDAFTEYKKSGGVDFHGIEINTLLAWLEKQAESERVIKAARRVLNNWLDGTDCPDVSGDFVELEYAIREYDGYENQKEQKPVPFSCGHENGKPTEWDNLQEEFRNINEAFEDGKKEVIDHPDKYGLTKQKSWSDEDWAGKAHTVEIPDGTTEVAGNRAKTQNK